MTGLPRMFLGWTVGLVIASVIGVLVPHGFLAGVVLGWGCTMVGVIAAVLTEHPR